MAKSWFEVEQSLQYRLLPLQDRLSAKQEYWDAVIAVKPEFQNLPGRDKNLARQEFFGQQQIQSAPFSPKQQQVERQIAQRPSQFQPLMQRMQQFQQHPFKTLTDPFRDIKTGLGVLQAGYGTAEAPIASAGLAAQRGELFTPQAGKEIIGGLAGQRPAQLGDIVRTTGFGRGWNELLASTTGLFATMGITNLATRGKLIQSVNKARNFVSSKMPRIMNKNYIIDRAKTASGGLDDLYKGLSKEYDDLYNKINVYGGRLGEQVVDKVQLQSVIDDLPQNIISKMAKSKLFQKLPDGSISPTLNNLKIMKTFIRQSVPEKIWSGKAIGDINTAQLENSYYKINSLMAQGNPELQMLNQRYSQFRQMQKALSSVLHDPDGNIKSKGLENLFKPGAERNRQLFFEQFAKQWPQAQQIMKDVIKFSRRQGLKAGARRVAPWIPLIAGGGYMGSRWLGGLTGGGEEGGGFE